VALSEEPAKAGWNAEFKNQQIKNTESEIAQAEAAEVGDEKRY